MHTTLFSGLFTLALGASIRDAGRRARGSAVSAQTVRQHQPDGPCRSRFTRPLPAVNHLPKDAPNILIVLIDDVGPAQTDTYGGEIHTPTLSKIAKAGISYNRFHTTAMCSPTRAALLTGRNHHRVAQRPDRRAGERLGRIHGHHPEEQRHRRRGAQGLRLQHGGLGEVAQHAGRANHRRRSLRLLAHRAMAFNISTASSPAKRRSTNRNSSATRPTSNIPARPAGTITII